MTSPQASDGLEGYLFELPPEDQTWGADWFPAGPLEIEIGSGKGMFLLNAGHAHPERNFVGVELSRKYAREAARRVAKAALANVRVVRGDARRFLARVVPARRVRAVHVYFPDPWWKKRHRKRRVFCEALVSDTARVLEPEGLLLLATDVEEYFGVMRELMAGRSDFAPLSDEAQRTLPEEVEYLTNFERKYRIEGRPIFRAGYRFTGAGEEMGGAL
jgi:tRNA (guanine-N7-)-methyltransferase